MGYTPENNPYIPGDPYSYDLKWMISEIKRISNLYDPLSQEFQALYNYVHDFLDNLDFPQEVSDKLEEMAADGTLYDILKPYFIEYVTPQMYGAAGDGIADDSQAIESAFNSGKNVYIPCGVYKITRMINVNVDRLLILGEKILTKTGAAADQAATIKADPAFIEDYMISFNGQLLGSQILNCAMQMFNLCIDCNDATGGVYIPNLYDNCLFTSVSILNVKPNKIGFYSPATDGNLTQTVQMESVWITGTVGTSSDSSSTPLMKIERWQECEFSNLKIIGTNTDCLHILGARGLLFNECSFAQRNITGGVFSTKGDGIGVKIRAFALPGEFTQISEHITFVNCLNEGCKYPLDIFATAQRLTGTFSGMSSADRGKTITQGANTGYIVDATTTSIYIILDDASTYFTTGSCSVGTISSTSTDYLSGGYKIINHKMMGNTEAVYRFEGISNSDIEIAQSAAGLVHKLIALNNYGVNFKYPYIPTAPSLFDFANSTLDGSMNIESAETLTLYAAGTLTLPIPALGLKLKVINNTGGGFNMQPYAGTTIDGFTSTPYYTNVVELIGISTTKWRMITGMHGFAVTVGSGGTLSNSVNTTSNASATISFRITLNAGSFTVNTPVVPRDNIYFLAYNETTNQAVPCVLTDTGLIQPRLVTLTSGDVIVVQVSFIPKVL